MSTCAHCGIVRVHITLFFQCSKSARIRFSYIEFHGQTTQQLLFFYHLEPHHEAFALIRRPTQTLQCKSNKIVFNALSPRRMNIHAQVKFIYS
jgi:hypothetical protein